MFNLLMTVTCLLSTGDKTLSFEVTEDKKVQQLQVFDPTPASLTTYFANNETITDSRITFSAHDADGDLMNVTINTESTMQYGESSIQFKSVNEQTSCFIGNW